MPPVLGGGTMAILPVPALGNNINTKSSLIMNNNNQKKNQDKPKIFQPYNLDNRKINNNKNVIYHQTPIHHQSGFYNHYNYSGVSSMTL